MNVPLRGVFEEAVRSPPEGLKFIYLTDTASYAEELIGNDKYFPVYLSAMPEDNAFTVDEFITCLNSNMAHSHDFYYLPICSAGRNRELQAALAAGYYQYSPDAWKAFQDKNRNSDYYRRNPDELRGIAAEYVHKCEGAGSPVANNTTNGDKNQFTVMSARELQKADLPPIRFIVGEIIPQGLALLCSPAKYGKSWLTLDLCLSVALGETFLGFPTEKCGVLYLALEDSYRRLKTRMDAILKGRAAPEGFDYVISAPTLDNGLDGYLRQYIKEKPNVGLIAIDVLQKVRSAASLGGNAYAAEYADLTILKKVADEFNISILLLHHNRKMADGSDPFNMISGTMALMGTADTSLILYREKRTDEQTILSITGRDVEMNSYKIIWDKQTFRQKLIGNVNDIQAANDEDEYYADPVVVTIKALLKKNTAGVTRTSGEFLTEIPKYAGVIFTGNEKKLGCHFVKLRPKLYHYDKIIHKKDRRAHTFKYEDENIVPFRSFEQVAINGGDDD